MTKKSMILACILAFIPGVGLIYIEKKLFGIIVMVVEAFGILISLTGILAIFGFPIILITHSIAGIATIVGVIKYPGGWKWF